MSQHREPRDVVSHTVRLYHRDILGPTAMWLGVVEALTPATATAVLDSLPQDTKEHLRAVYLDRPPHVYIARSPSEPGDEDFQAVCVQVVRWCEAGGPPPEVPTEPDGLIRVRVEGDRVTEWRPWEERRSSSVPGGPTCPRCGGELVRPVTAPGEYPRYSACRRCCYPLESAALRERVERGPVTDAATGYCSYPTLESRDPEQAAQTLRRVERYGVDPVAEFADGVIFRVMNDYYVFNFGLPGGCSSHWSTLWSGSDPESGSAEPGAAPDPAT